MKEPDSQGTTIMRPPWAYQSLEVSAMTAEGQSPQARARNRRRIDPRVSIIVLLLLNVIAFATPYRWLLYLAVALDAALLLWCGKGRLAVYWLMGYAAVNAICYGCIAAGPAFTPFGTCFLYMSKIFPAAMFATAMIATTRTGELACALQTFKLPSRFTVATCVALRFFPTIGREARSVREAMRLRGERFSPARAICHPGALFEGFIVPFIHRISIVADELGDAVMCRGADTSRRRTSYHELSIGLPEILVMAAIAALLVFTVLGKLG